MSDKHIASVAYSKCGLCGVEYKGHESPRTVQENAFVQLLTHFKVAHAGKGFTCGRRAENGMDRDDSPLVGSAALADMWLPRDGVDRCSYCGSLSPEEFFKRVGDGQKVCPTDKSYKAYIGTDSAKFYFQHLTREDQQLFIDHINSGRMQLDAPGYFYIRPFFIAPPPRMRGQAVEE